MTKNSGAGLKKCVVPGSFNPFTLGHLDIVIKCLKDYDEVIVAVAAETYKEGVLPLGGRVLIAEKSIGGLKNVNVMGFEGNLTDFLIKMNIFTIVRGVRGPGDMEYEDMLAAVYKKMEPRINIEYVSAQNIHISSSAVRKIVREGGSLEKLAAAQAIDDIMRLYS